MLTGLVIAPLTAIVGAAMLRARTWPTFALTAYVILIGQIVAISEVLSLIDAVTATRVLIAEALTAVVVAVAATLRGWSVPAMPRFDLPGPLLALAALIGAAIAYELALVIFTAPNNWDSMTYHLSRAAAWYQRHRVGYIDAHTQRENNSAPNAEILVLFSFLFVHSDRIAAIWQWLAQLAAITSVYVIAGRIDVSRRARLFAALLFATMAQPALQASSTQNDLLAASLVGVAVAFLCTTERWRYPLAALALGLALGTKLTVALALPAVALIGLTLVPKRDRLRLFALAAAAFVAVGAFGYILNLAHTGAIQGNGAAVAQWSQHSWHGRAMTLITVPAKMVVVINPIDQDSAYFGGLGGLVIIPVIAIALRHAWQRRRLSLEATLALALPLFLIALAYTNRFNDWMGRFLIIPVVLVAPLAVLLYRRRRYAAVVAAVGVISLFFSITDNIAKPIGLFGHDSVWTISRTQQQARLRPALLPVLDRLASIPPRARVGYSIAEDDWDYPLYGSQLDRRLVQLPHGDELAAGRRDGLRWLIIRDSRLRDQPRFGWVVIKLGHSGLDLVQPTGSRISAAA